MRGAKRNRIDRRSLIIDRLPLRRALFQGMLPGFIKVVPAVVTVAIAMTSSRALMAEYNRRV